MVTSLPLQLTNDSSREASAGLLVPPPALNNEAKQNEDKTADTTMCFPGLAAGAAKTTVRLGHSAVLTDSFASASVFE
jgi:hypothetical protein